MSSCSCDRRPAMALYPPEFPWLSKPAAVSAVADAIVVSALAARGEIGYLDYAGSEQREGAPFWPPLRGRRRRWEVEERLALQEFDAPEDNVERALDQLPRRRADPAVRKLRVRRIGLPFAAATRDLAARPVAALGPRPRDRARPRLGAELPRARVGDRAVRGAGDGARRRRPVFAVGSTCAPRCERGTARAAPRRASRCRPRPARRRDERPARDRPRVPCVGRAAPAGTKARAL